MIIARLIFMFIKLGPRLGLPKVPFYYCFFLLGVKFNNNNY